jgi:hypothetical protein
MMKSNFILETEIAFVGSLVTAVQGVLPLFARHLRENSNEILPHVFFADLADDILTDTEQKVWIPEMLEFFDSHFLGDEYDPIKNLIAVSFIEQLPYSGRSVIRIVEMLPGRLRAEYDQVSGNG